LEPRSLCCVWAMPTSQRRGSHEEDFDCAALQASHMPLFVVNDDVSQLNFPPFPTLMVSAFLHFCVFRSSLFFPIRFGDGAVLGG
jgi:hypothetical protein